MHDGIHSSAIHSGDSEKFNKDQVVGFRYVFRNGSWFGVAEPDEFISIIDPLCS